MGSVLEPIGKGISFCLARLIFIHVTFLEKSNALANVTRQFAVLEETKRRVRSHTCSG
jgi:hypothetical protein